MRNSESTTASNSASSVESHGRLFLRFLRFGCLAWGGPVAQIEMIRHELVAQERWVTPEYFRRLLAVYQVLPGPEATELCIHFGMLKRGRWAGVIAGVGFLLPGFLLILALSWLYLNAGLAEGPARAVFLGVQPAVIAIIVRACHRIAWNCLTNAPLWVIAAAVAVMDALGVPFWITLGLAGASHAAIAARPRIFVAVAAVACAVAITTLHRVHATRQTPHTAAAAEGHSTTTPTTAALFGSGLRAGLLTFGGAYTAIPFVKRDAVETDGWMSEPEFLDGLALSGILPAPLIIFSTFVGFVGGGLGGALAMTIGIFLPAFLFPLLFHRHLEPLLHHGTLRDLLDGVTAGVVGIIATTTVRLGYEALTTAPSFAIAGATLALLYVWKSKAAIPLAILAGGIAGAWIWSS